MLLEVLLFSVDPPSPLLYGPVLKNDQYKLLQKYSVLQVKQFTFLHVDAYLLPAITSIPNTLVKITSSLLIQMATEGILSI